MLANLQETKIQTEFKRKKHTQQFHLCCMIDDDIELHPWKKTDLPAFWLACKCVRERDVEIILMRLVHSVRNLKYFMGKLDAINPIVLERAADAHQRNYR